MPLSANFRREMLVAIKQAKKNKDKQPDSDDADKEKMNQGSNIVTLGGAMSSRPTEKSDGSQAKEVASKVGEHKT